MPIKEKGTKTVMSLMMVLLLTYWEKLEYCSSTVTLLNTLRTGDADLRFYITTVQDG